MEESKADSKKIPKNVCYCPKYEKYGVFHKQNPLGCVIKNCRSYLFHRKGQENEDEEEAEEDME